MESHITYATQLKTNMLDLRTQIIYTTALHCWGEILTLYSSGTVTTTTTTITLLFDIN